MKNQARKHCLRLLRPLLRKEGQDLVEYALVVAMIAFATAAGVKSVATDMNSFFTYIGTTLDSYTT
jgi:pilus assembly protein Flp/PilA